MSNSTMLTLKTFVLPMILSFIRGTLFKENADWVMKFFAMLRSLVLRSENKIDDILFIPIINQIEVATSALNDENFVMTFIQEFLTELLNNDKPSVWADTILDFIEDSAKASDTSWDDKIIIPMVEMARHKLGLIK